MDSEGMNTRACAAYCGTTTKGLEAWVRSKGFPRRRIGSRVLYVKTEVDEWLKTRPTERVFRKKRQHLVNESQNIMGRKRGRPVKEPVPPV